MMPSPLPGFLVSERAQTLGPGATYRPISATLAGSFQPTGVLVKQTDGSYSPVPDLSASADPTTGIVSLLLPIGTDCIPVNPTITLTLTYGDGTVYTASGVTIPAMVNGSGTLENLRDMWGWSFPALATVGVPTGPLSAVGDLAVGGTLGVANRLPAGADGLLLGTDSTQPTGLRWIEPERAVLAGTVTTTYPPGGAIVETHSSGLVVTTTYPPNGTEVVTWSGLGPTRTRVTTFNPDGSEVEVTS